MAGSSVGGGALCDIGFRAVNTSRYLLGREPLRPVAPIDTLFRSAEHAGWERIQRGNKLKLQLVWVDEASARIADSAVINRSNPPRESRAQRCRNSRAAVRRSRHSGQGRN